MSPPLAPDGAPCAVDDKNLSIRKAPACPTQDIVALYNQILAVERYDDTDTPAALSACKSLTKKREAQIRARWRERYFAGDFYSDRETGLEYWRRFFLWVRKSHYLMGRCAPTPPREEPFRADLEWLTAPNNFAKTIERKYHRRHA